MCTHIDKDIVTLGKEVKEVKQKAQVCTAYMHIHCTFRIFYVINNYGRIRYRYFMKCLCTYCKHFIFMNASTDDYRLAQLITVLVNNN